MTAKLVYGKPIAQKMRAELKDEVARLTAGGVQPCLASVQVGDDGGSRLYVKRQAEDCRRLGIRHRAVVLSDDATHELVKARLRQLSDDSEITGIILQLPLPNGLDTIDLQAAIDRRKDVEGVNIENLGRLVQGRIELAPSTPLAAFTLVRSTGVDLYGKEVVVVGHSPVVGRPMALMLMQEFSTVTTCHIGTKCIEDYTRRADLLVVAAGVPGLITGDMVKPGAFVVDIGINRVRLSEEEQAGGKKKWKTVGDVDFDSVSRVAGFLTPVPGGVGPLTVTMLLKNIVRAAVGQLGNAS